MNDPPPGPPSLTTSSSTFRNVGYQITLKTHQCIHCLRRDGLVYMRSEAGRSVIKCPAVNINSTFRAHRDHCPPKFVSPKSSKNVCSLQVNQEFLRSATATEGFAVFTAGTSRFFLLKDVLEITRHLPLSWAQNRYPAPFSGFRLALSGNGELGVVAFASGSPGVWSLAA